MTTAASFARGVRLASLASMYRAATPTQLWAGRAWYRGAAEATVQLVQRAALGNIYRENAAALLALLSPRCSWRTNVRRAIAVADRYGRGEADPAAVPGIFARVKPKVRAACDAFAARDALFDPLTAPKTSAFFRNLCGDLSAVTVDVWAARAVGIDPDDLSDPETYNRAARLYVDAAREVGDDPASVQAVVWCVTRGANGVLQEAPRWFGLPSTVA